MARDVPGDDKLARRAAKTRATTMARHVLVCVDDDCDGGPRFAKRLRRAVADAGLRAEVSVARMRCLGICRRGPVVVVYPEGAWYAGLGDADIPRLVAEHLQAGRLLADRLFLHNPLHAALPGAGSGTGGAASGPDAAASPTGR